MNSKTVRLSGDTMSILEKNAKPFESPDECLKRILSQNPCKTKESEEVKEHEIESENQKDE